MSGRWLAGVAAVALASGCAYVVPPGRVAVIRNEDGRVRVVEAGKHHLQLTESAVVYDARPQERRERIEVRANNGIAISIEVSIRFHLVYAEVEQLDAELGTEYYATFLAPTLRAQARRAAAAFSPEELDSIARERLERQLEEAVQRQVTGRHLEVESVRVEKVELPKVLREVRDAQLRARDQELRLKLELEAKRAELEALERARALEDAGQPTPPTDP